MNSYGTEVIIALIATIPAVIAALYARRGSLHSKDTNDAVNHTHGTGNPRLYDLALENREDVKLVASQVINLDERLDGMGEKVEDVSTKLDAHIRPAEECLLDGCLRREMLEAETAKSESNG